MKLRKTNKKGFTLVELIVVIAIIAIIAAIAIPTTIVYVGRANDSSAQSEADSVVRTIRESIASAVMTGDALDATYFVGELNEQMGGAQYANKVTITYAADADEIIITAITSRDGDGDGVVDGKIAATSKVSMEVYEIDMTTFDDVTITKANEDAAWTAA